MATLSEILGSEQFKSQELGDRLSTIGSYWDKVKEARPDQARKADLLKALSLSGHESGYRSAYAPDGPVKNFHQENFRKVDSIYQQAKEAPPGSLDFAASLRDYGSFLSSSAEQLTQARKNEDQMLQAAEQIVSLREEGQKKPLLEQEVVEPLARLFAPKAFRESEKVTTEIAQGEPMRLLRDAAAKSGIEFKEGDEEKVIQQVKTRRGEFKEPFRVEDNGGLFASGEAFLLPKEEAFKQAENSGAAKLEVEDFKKEFDQRRKDYVQPMIDMHAKLGRMKDLQREGKGSEEDQAAEMIRTVRSGNFTNALGKGLDELGMFLNDIPVLGVLTGAIAKDEKLETKNEFFDLLSQYREDKYDYDFMTSAKRAVGGALPSLALSAIGAKGGQIVGKALGLGEKGMVTAGVVGSAALPSVQSATGAYAQAREQDKSGLDSLRLAATSFLSEFLPTVALGRTGKEALLVREGSKEAQESFIKRLIKEPAYEGAEEFLNFVADSFWNQQELNPDATVDDWVKGAADSTIAGAALGLTGAIPRGAPAPVPPKPIDPDAADLLEGTSEAAPASAAAAFRDVYPAATEETAPASEPGDLTAKVEDIVAEEPPETGQTEAQVATTPEAPTTVEPVEEAPPATEAPAPAQPRPAEEGAEAATPPAPLTSVEEKVLSEAVASETISKEGEIEGFHGTAFPVDEFTTEKIGSGEGEQAFGWGMYFAGVKATAEYYKGKVLGMLSEKNRPRTGLGEGNVYKVRINISEDEFLDWDKPLKEQSAKVQEYFGKLGLGGPEWSGRALYEEYYVNHTYMGTPKAGSRKLWENGIKGIRYLDQHSRGEGVGTNNYVVFDNSNVAITGVNEGPSVPDSDAVTSTLEPEAAATPPAPVPAEEASAAPPQATPQEALTSVKRDPSKTEQKTPEETPKTWKSVRSALVGGLQRTNGEGSFTLTDGSTYQVNPLSRDVGDAGEIMDLQGNFYPVSAIAEVSDRDGRTIWKLGDTADSPPTPAPEAPPPAPPAAEETPGPAPETAPEPAAQALPTPEGGRKTEAARRGEELQTKKDLESLSQGQRDAVYSKEFDRSEEQAFKKATSEFQRTRKIVSRYEDGTIKSILTLSAKDPKKLQYTFFTSKGEPAGDSEYPKTKEGLREAIEDNNIWLSFFRKDVPDTAGIGLGDERYVHTYRLRLRDVSLGTHPKPGLATIVDSRTVEYPIILTEQEISDFELEPIGHRLIEGAAPEPAAQAPTASAPPTPTQALTPAPADETQATTQDQVQEASRATPEQGQPPVAEAEGEAEAGVARGESEGQEGASAQEVEISEFDKNGKLTATEQVGVDEALDRLDKRGKFLEALKDCVGRK